MVQSTQLDRLEDGSIDIEAWLGKVGTVRKPEHIRLIRHACVLSQLAGEEQATFTGESCLNQGLSMADILLRLGLDHEAIAAAIVYDSVQYADLQIEDIAEHLGKPIAKLLEGVEQMENVRMLTGHEVTQQQPAHKDSLRRMFLSMVDDVRVVVIKLAERTCVLRAGQYLDRARQVQVAHEILDIYAPLASRLGIGELKWELEDLAFRFLKPEVYKETAKMLSERRVDREQYVENLLQTLTNMLDNAHVCGYEIMGRPKHIYSIYRKMQRKNVHFEEIYDAIAVRVLCHSIEDCYTVLSNVHETWQQIPKEFDDYVAKPKANGYRSIHTAVIGPEGKNVEVQIRTYDMHKESELGLAAHWRYKEGSGQSTQEEKIAWLRQLLSWQKTLVIQGEAPLAEQQQNMFSDQIYVFTPAGDIVNLPTGATPLDFAYHIHSEVGHRCRGAKVNGNMVQLTHALKTGEQIEIITTREAKPSRDWLNSHLGYLKTSRAKAKVHHWFRQRDYSENLNQGRDVFEQECKRLGVTISLQELNKIAPKFNFKASDDLLAALGRNDVKLGQIFHHLRPEETQQHKELPESKPSLPPRRQATSNSGIQIEGVGNLLTHIAKCCQPLPGEAISGYITVGHGVTIHKNDCPDLLHHAELYPERILEVTWCEQATETHIVDLVLSAYDRRDLLRDITGVLSTEKANLLSLSTSTDKDTNSVTTHFSLEVNSLTQLRKVMDKLKQLPNIIDVHREHQA